jgi:dTDP-4-dehydrorhamnose 3,5-epimerase
MNFTETPLAGAWLIEPTRHADERGYFARTFDPAAMRAHGIDFEVVQSSVSFNPRPGTLRGMHFQRAPHGEAKLIRCVRGAIFDVLVDVEGRQWYGAELSAENGRALYAPRHLAHGFQTLLPDTEVLYMMDAPYVPEAASGVRWSDPAFGIAWPEPPEGGRLISARDDGYPDV